MALWFSFTDLLTNGCEDGVCKNEGVNAFALILSAACLDGEEQNLRTSKIEEGDDRVGRWETEGELNRDSSDVQRKGRKELGVKV